MGYEIPIIIAYNTLLLVLGAAWVAGYLDGLQHTAQDFALGKAGENRASYGLKSTISSQRVTDNKDVNKAQDDLGNAAGGLVGKGGVGEDAGGLLSKGL